VGREVRVTGRGIEAEMPKYISLELKEKAESDFYLELRASSLQELEALL